MGDRLEAAVALLAAERSRTSAKTGSVLEGQAWFFVSFVSELTPSDRDTPKRPNWKLDEDPRTFRMLWSRGDAPSDMAWRHFARLPASGVRDAMRSVVDTLGHARDGLRAFSAREANSD